MTTSQANAFQSTIKNLAEENENIQDAFQQIVHAHEQGIQKIQNNTYGTNQINSNWTLKKMFELFLLFFAAKQFITSEIRWYNNMEAVFMQIYPQINTFAEAIIEDGVTNQKAGTFNVNIKSLNLSIRETVEKLLHLIAILGDYFQIFDSKLISIQNQLKPKAPTSAPTKMHKGGK